MDQFDIVETEILHSKATVENEEEEANRELVDLIEEVDQDDNDDPEKIDCVYKGLNLPFFVFALHPIYFPPLIPAFSNRKLWAVASKVCVSCSLFLLPLNNQPLY